MHGNENPAAAGQPQAGCIGNRDTRKYSPDPAADQAAPRTKCEWALYLASRGFHVLPLRENAKVPLLRHWQEKATRDPDVIRRTWSDDRPNIGIRTGGGVLVLDVDFHKGAKGLETLAGLEMIYDPIGPTFRTRTASGGQHVYFRVREEYSGIIGRIGPGLDIRCTGNQVVAPGSTIDGRAYEVLDASPLAEAPRWLLDKLQRFQAPAVVESRHIPLVDLDQAHAVQRATHYLEREAPIAISGAAGNATTYGVAARLKDLGVSEPMALDLMLDHWNDRCGPPWEADELRVVVGNAYRYGRSRPGSAAPEAQFGPIETIEAKPRLLLPETIASDGDVTIAWDDAEDWESEPEPLIDGLVNQGEVGFLYGAPGAGKSLLALRACHSISAGEPFGPHFTAQGGVLYLMGEAHGGARKRKAAARKMLGGQGLPINFVLTNLNLLARGAERVLQHCERFEDAFGSLPRLIILDTLAALAAGLEESESRSTTLLMHTLRKIATATGATILVVAHEGKDASRGLRGSSALLGAADFVLHADKDKRVLSAQKLREDEAPPKLGYEIVGVEVGRRRDGRVIRSAIANVLSTPRKNLAAIEADLRADQRDLLRLVRSLASGLPADAVGATVKEIAQAAQARGLVKAAGEKNTVNSVRERLKRLQRVGLLTSFGDHWQITRESEEEGAAP